MKKTITISLLISIIFFINNPLLAQQTTAFLLAGELTDIDENPIVAKTANVKITFANLPEPYSFEENIRTNNTGKFLLSIKDMPEIFSDISETEIIEIQISLTSDEDWLDSEHLTVNYFLNKKHNLPELSEDSIPAPMQFEMNRFGRQELYSTSLNNVYKFADSSAFSYLKCDFLMSLNPQITDPLSILKTAMEAEKSSKIETQNDNAKSRGIKGAYAVGGYNKKVKKED